MKQGDGSLSEAVIDEINDAPLTSLNEYVYTKSQYPLGLSDYAWFQGLVFVSLKFLKQWGVKNYYRQLFS